MQPCAFQRIWVEQCDATRVIRTRFGIDSALSYLIGEKLLNFAEAAARDSAFATELPGFISEIRTMFTPNQIRTEIDRVERMLRKEAAAARRWSKSRIRERAAISAKVSRFSTLQDVLLAPVLGVS